MGINGINENTRAYNGSIYSAKTQESASVNETVKKEGGEIAAVYEKNKTPETETKALPERGKIGNSPFVLQT